jgi:hypothetical protein
MIICLQSAELTRTSAGSLTATLVAPFRQGLPAAAVHDASTANAAEQQCHDVQGAAPTVR